MSGWIETPLATAERVKKWKEGWGDWARTFQWSHWVTLTTGQRQERILRRSASGHIEWTARRIKSGPLTSAQLLRAFVDEFVRNACKVAQAPVPYFFAIEGGALGDRPHLHALLDGTENLGVRQLERAWRHGRAQVGVYDAQRGAAHYLAKEIGSRVIDYGMSGRLPPHTAEYLERRP